MFKTLTIKDGEIIPSVHQDEHWLQEKFLFAGDYDIENFPSHIPWTEVQFLVVDNGDSRIIAEFVKNGLNGQAGFKRFKRSIRFSTVL